MLKLQSLTYETDQKVQNAVVSSCKKTKRMPRLLILACSARKRLEARALPAIERYDGVNFRILKKLQREQNFPSDLNVPIQFLSTWAKYI